MAVRETRILGVLSRAGNPAEPDGMYQPLGLATAMKMPKPV